MTLITKMCTLNMFWYLWPGNGHYCRNTRFGLFTQSILAHQSDKSANRSDKLHTVYKTLANRQYEVAVVCCGRWRKHMLYPLHTLQLTTQTVPWVSFWPFLCFQPYPSCLSGQQFHGWEMGIELVFAFLLGKQAFSWALWKTWCSVLCQHDVLDLHRCIRQFCILHHVLSQPCNVPEQSNLPLSYLL